MKKGYKVESIVGAFVLLGLVCLGYLTMQLGQVQFFGPDYYQLQARFSNVGGLRSGNSVQIAGVQVGQVQDIELDQERYVALVQLQIREGVRLTDDTMAAIKTSGLIGDKYISLSPGGSGIYLEPGETIIETQSPFDIQEMLGKYVFGDSGD
ncbi:MAG: outer membrane lipid asymmetry maintenance protein MlaD [Thermodesulfobacteriota bacterium]